MFHMNTTSAFSYMLASFPTRDRRRLRVLVLFASVQEIKVSCCKVSDNRTCRCSTMLNAAKRTSFFKKFSFPFHFQFLFSLFLSSFLFISFIHTSPSFPPLLFMLLGIIRNRKLIFLWFIAGLSTEERERLVVAYKWLFSQMIFLTNPD